MDIFRWRGGDLMAVKVLIVDDALFMRTMMKDILMSAGIEVVGEASNGKEAVEKYRELSPDLVTMDILMPVKSGIDAVRDIMALDRNARIIICSIMGQESLVREAIQAGAREFITKPFSKEKVLDVIHKVMNS